MKAHRHLLCLCHQPFWGHAQKWNPWLGWKLCCRLLKMAVLPAPSRWSTLRGPASVRGVPGPPPARQHCHFVLPGVWTAALLMGLGGHHSRPAGLRVSDEVLPGHLRSFLGGRFARSFSRCKVGSVVSFRRPPQVPASPLTGPDLHVLSRCALPLTSARRAGHRSCLNTLSPICSFPFSQRLWCRSQELFS